MVAPDTCGSSVCTLIDATLLGPKVLGWPQDFWNNCASPVMTIFRRREQLMQFLIFALNNKFTTNNCSCPSNRFHVQESLRAFINETQNQRHFWRGNIKFRKSHNCCCKRSIDIVNPKELYYRQRPYYFRKSKKNLIMTGIAYLRMRILESQILYSVTFRGSIAAILCFLPYFTTVLNDKIMASLNNLGPHPSSTFSVLKTSRFAKCFCVYLEGRKESQSVKTILKDDNIMYCLDYAACCEQNGAYE